MLCSLLGSVVVHAGEGPVSITDDRGRQIVLEEPASRVICLYGALTDMFLAMGRTDLLVARTAADGEHPVLESLPSIGTHMRPNVELALSLSPDLVLQMGSRDAVLEPVARLESLGVPVAVFQPVDLAGVYSVLDRIGVLTASEVQAARAAGDMRTRIDAVRQRLASVPENGTPSVFFEIRYPNLLAAGSTSLVSEIIDLAGGTNCVEAPDRMARLGEEWLLSLDPDLYVIQTGPMNPAPVHPSQRPLFRNLRAVSNGRVHFVEERLFSRPGPGLAQAVEELARILHPRLFGPAVQAATPEPQPTNDKDME